MQIESFFTRNVLMLLCHGAIERNAMHILFQIVIVILFRIHTDSIKSLFTYFTHIFINQPSKLNGIKILPTFKPEFHFKIMIKDTPLLRKEGLGVVTELLFIQKTKKDEWQPFSTTPKSPP